MEKREGSYDFVPHQSDFGREYGLSRTSVICQMAGHLWGETYGPMPPTRSIQLPYASIVGNPVRTASDMWEYLVNGRVRLYSKRRDHLLGPLLESKLAFATQKGKAKADGVQVRYISDPRNEIDERIEPKTRPTVRVPQHANVVRTVLYWKRRYPPTPVLLCKRGVEGAFELLPLAICALPHMGVHCSKYMIMYLSLYFGWKHSPASWGVTSSLLPQYVASSKTE